MAVGWAILVSWTGTTVAGLNCMGVFDTAGRDGGSALSWVLTGVGVSPWLGSDGVGSLSGTGEWYAISWQHLWNQTFHVIASGVSGFFWTTFHLRSWLHKTRHQLGLLPGPLSICVYYRQTLVSCVQSHLLWVQAVPWCFGCSNVSASLAFGISCVSRPSPIRALEADGQWVTAFWFVFQTYVVLASFSSLQSGCCASLEDKTGNLLQFQWPSSIGSSAFLIFSKAVSCSSFHSHWAPLCVSRRNGSHVWQIF